MRFRSFPLACALVLLAAHSLSAAPTPTDPTAQQILAQSEATAKAAQKNILLDFSASWCGNCHLFEHFVADPTIRPILEKYFVTVTLITGERANDTRHSNTPGGQQAQESLGGKSAGWPYIVILDAGGKPIVDSFRPLSGGKKTNIGYPDSRVEVDWFMQMLQTSTPSLSPQETATIHSWLSAHGH